MSGCQLTDGTRHYEVLTPMHETDPGNPYGWSPEPPEYGCCWAVFEAESPAKAKAQAIADPDFRSWRDQVVNPFRGLTVRLFRCEHGTCLACVESEFCPECEAEFADQDDVA